MKDYWFISDTHFQHEGAMRWSSVRKAKFSSVEECDETMIENWNSLVKPGDYVYHLGDVTFGSKVSFAEKWKRLNGHKRLIVGNHDDVKYLSGGSFFRKVKLWHIWHDIPVIFSHVPIHPDSIVERASLNVHGHTHDKGSPEGPYRSVCVEQTDFKPVNLEQIKEWI